MNSLLYQNNVEHFKGSISAHVCGKVRNKFKGLNILIFFKIIPV